MIETEKKLEFNQIKSMLMEYGASNRTKVKCRELSMEMDEVKLRRALRETTEARKILDAIGLPPLGGMQGMEEVMEKVVEGYYLLPEQIGVVGIFLVACERMVKYLKRSEYLNLGLSHYSGSFCAMEELKERIEISIRGNEVNDSASVPLKRIRREMADTEDKMREKMEHLIRSKKNYLADSLIMQRNGHFVLPVKKEYRAQIEGAVCDKSATGNTLFIEPLAVSRLQAVLAQLELDEDNEVKKILCAITAEVEAHLEDFNRNRDLMCDLDFAFAKGKLSAQMNGREAAFTTDRRMVIKEGLHPLLDREICVPLNFSAEEQQRGIVITGPNTGGKTVALKAVGLLAMMVQCGLHVPVGEGSLFCMNTMILCDIGDGQNISENLSTFSAHINRITDILKKSNKESLILLDELGSGTDPAEGMGIAISILEALRQKGCLFAATTHYPEVKGFAEKAEGLINARMLFDKESLKPLYQLEIGRAGESCALHIARRLGFPKELIEIARIYAGSAEEKIAPVGEWTKILNQEQGNVGAGIKKEKIRKEKKEIQFAMGDSVMVFPQKEKGLVYEIADEKGEIGVQIKGRKKKIPYKRLKLLVKAEELYPEAYDFSVVFDTKENRKAKKVMGKRHEAGTAAYYESGMDNIR